LATKWRNEAKKIYSAAICDTDIHIAEMTIRRLPKVLTGFQTDVSIACLASRLRVQRFAVTADATIMAPIFARRLEWR
jgi:hypothetical protein